MNDSGDSDRIEGLAVTWEGSPMRPDFAGCRVPVDRRRLMASRPPPDERGRQLRRPYSAAIKIT